MTALPPDVSVDGTSRITFRSLDEAVVLSLEDRDRTVVIRLHLYGPDTQRALDTFAEEWQRARAVARGNARTCLECGGAVPTGRTDPFCSDACREGAEARPATARK